MHLPILFGVPPEVSAEAVWLGATCPSAVGSKACPKTNLRHHVVALVRRLGSATFHDHWNYMRRQVFVLDTYRNGAGRTLNHTMLGLLVFLGLTLSFPVVAGATAEPRFSVLSAFSGGYLDARAAARILCCRGYSPPSPGCAQHTLRLRSCCGQAANPKGRGWACCRRAWGPSSLLLV